MFLRYSIPSPCPFLSLLWLATRRATLRNVCFREHYSYQIDFAFQGLLSPRQLRA